MGTCNHFADRVPVIVTYDGTTRCCGAYTTIFIDDGTEYCKCCGRDVDGYDMTIPTAKENQ